MYTDEQIQKRAKDIGDRPYHQIVIESGQYYDAERGITIRQELMRTAMGGLCANPACIYRPQQDNGINYASESISIIAQDITNAILIQMAKDELGVKE